MANGRENRQSNNIKHTSALFSVVEPSLKVCALTWNISQIFFKNVNTIRHASLYYHYMYTCTTYMAFGTTYYIYIIFFIICLYCKVISHRWGKLNTTNQIWYSVINTTMSNNTVLYIYLPLLFCKNTAYFLEHWPRSHVPHCCCLRMLL